MVVVKILALGLFIAVGVTSLDPSLYVPFAPNGFAGVHQGAAIVFFAYIGFDAVSTAAEETKNPQRNLPIGILGGLAVCTVIYVVVGAVLTGMVPYEQLGVADPLSRALELAGYSGVGSVVALGAVVSMTAVLLVFQYGQPRIFFSMARDGLLPPWAARVDARTRIPRSATLVTGVLVALASLVGDAAETYDLTNIGTLFAFALVCAGVLVLRVDGTQSASALQGAMRLARGAARRGRVPVRHDRPSSPGLGALRVWLLLGAVAYLAYGYRHSRLRGRRTLEPKCRAPAGSTAMPCGGQPAVTYIAKTHVGRVPRSGPAEVNHRLSCLRKCRQ